MKKAMSIIFAIALMLSVSCARKVTLPVKTSLGNLTKIEKKDKVATNKDPVSPKAGEVIYLLSFEGKKEFEVKDVAVPEMIRLTGGLSEGSDIRFTDFSVSAAPELVGVINLPLVDSSGKEFAPVYLGRPGSDGAISNAGMRFNGRMTGKDGKPWVTTGKLDFPEGKVTLVYAVPDSATLSLRDGGQKHAIN